MVEAQREELLRDARDEPSRKTFKKFGKAATRNGARRTARLVTPADLEQAMSLELQKAKKDSRSASDVIHAELIRSIAGKAGKSEAATKKALQRSAKAET